MTFVKTQFSKIISNPRLVGILILLVGVFGLIFSTVVRNAYTLLYPSALLIGSIAYFGLRNAPKSELTDLNSQSIKLLLLMWLVNFAIVLVAYYHAGFWRTDTVFYLLFLLHILVGFYILLAPLTENNWLVPVGFGLILTTGLINRLTAFYASRMYLGPDNYGHSSLIASLVTDGFLLDTFINTKYYYAPLYHIQAAAGDLILGVSDKDALALTTMVSVLVLPALVAYALTRLVWGPRIALLAAFLYTVSDHAIKWSIYLIPNSLGIVFFALISLAMFKYLLDGDPKQYSIFVVGFFILMLTHQVSLFIALAASATVAIVAILCQNWSTIRGTNIILFSGLVVFLDFSTTDFRGPAGGASFFDLMLGGLITSLSTAGVQTRPEVSFPTNLPISLTGAAAKAHIQLAGSTLLLFFAIFGSLYWLHSQREDRSIFIGLGVGVAVTSMMTVALVGPVVGMRNLLPTRWWGFIYLFLAVLAAPGVVMLIRSVNSVSLPDRSTQILLLLLILIPYVTLMAGSTVGARDDPFIENGFDAQRNAITDEEIAIISHVERFSDDETPVLATKWFPISKSEAIRMEWGNPNSIVKEDPQLLINRKYKSSKHAEFWVQIDEVWYTVHGRVPIDQIRPDYRSTVYDSGDDEILWILR